MKNIQLTFYSDSNEPSKNMGSKKPAWLNNVDSVSNWYNDNVSYYYYNIVKGETNEIYTQYGANRSGWASVSFMNQSVKIINEEFKEDSSIDVTVEVELNFLKARIAPVSIAGWKVEKEVYIGDELQYEFKGNTRSNYDYGKREKVIIKTNVKPEENSRAASVQMFSHYPNGEVPDNNIKFGFGLYNPNPPHYIPMSLRKSNTWKSLDKEKGFIKKRVSNNWKDYSKENLSSSMEKDKGKNRFRRSGNWVQLPPM